MTQADAQELVRRVQSAAEGAGRVALMEVCGTHTVALFRTGIRSQLPANIDLISGPGCPVCVTSQGYIDAACEAAGRPDICVCTYGDMVRVPGRNGSLAEHRARGAEVRVVYSAQDALQHALAHRERQVLFLAVGFETTAPATAAVLKEARARDVRNFLVFASHKLVIPALHALLADADCGVDGFLCPGHVSVIIGSHAYVPVASQYGKPCVIAGFEPRQMLEGVLRLVQQVRVGDARVENVYGVAVTEQGNRTAWGFVEEVFEPGDAEWRAIGTIPGSGLLLREEYADFDAVRRLELDVGENYEPAGCRCGDVIQGKANPEQCPLFANACTPAQPVGPCMVSSEGSCAAYYKYGRWRER